MITSNLFVSGTDTGVGKTYITGLIAAHLYAHNVNVVTQKWIQTGSEFFSDDLDAHITAMGRTRNDFKSHFTDMNPYCFSFPASPHLAAKKEAITIDHRKIISSFHRLSHAFESVIVEGAGGLLVPYSESHTMIDIVSDLNLPVLLVVENKLGCINHTLLSLNYIQQRGLQCFGIVLNTIPLTNSNRDSASNPEILSNNFEYLKSATSVPVITPDSLSELLNLITHKEYLETP